MTSPSLRQEFQFFFIPSVLNMIQSTSAYNDSDIAVASEVVDDKKKYTLAGLHRNSSGNTA